MRSNKPCSKPVGKDKFADKMIVNIYMLRTFVGDKILDEENGTVIITKKSRNAGKRCMELLE